MFYHNIYIVMVCFKVDVHIGKVLLAQYQHLVDIVSVLFQLVLGRIMHIHYKNSTLLYNIVGVLDQK